MTVTEQFEVGRYMVPSFDEDLPLSAYNAYENDGRIYTPIMVYDLPRSIAIEAKGSFVGKEVVFLRV